MSSEFIKMVADLSERRLLRKIQSLVADKTPCGILFAPQVPLDARATVNSLKNIGLNINCLCFLVEEQKKIFDDTATEMLVTLDEFPNLSDPPKFILVMERYFGTAFMEYFKACGTDMFFLPNVEAAEIQYELYMKHLPELSDVHEMLADDESKKIFRAAITGRITRLMQDFIFTTEHEYFLNGFLPKAGDIAIDGGSYDGDTAADFVRQGATVYAFEMDVANYQLCIAPAKKFNFTIENLGLSNQRSEAFYSQGGWGSRKLAEKRNGALVGHFIDLDTYVDLKELPCVDYIKLDIEGSELAALCGAAKTITRWKPKMAICVYHKPEDLWTLPTYIKSLRSDYEFQFRHHRCDRRKQVNGNSYWAALQYFNVDYHTPSEYDMILYCR